MGCVTVAALETVISEETVDTDVVKPGISCDDVEGTNVTEVLGLIDDPAVDNDPSVVEGEDVIKSGFTGEACVELGPGSTEAEEPSVEEVEDEKAGLFLQCLPCSFMHILWKTFLQTRQEVGVDLVL